MHLNFSHRQIFLATSESHLCHPRHTHPYRFFQVLRDGELLSIGFT